MRKAMNIYVMGMDSSIFLVLYSQVFRGLSTLLRVVAHAWIDSRPNTNQWYGQISDGTHNICLDLVQVNPMDGSSKVSPTTAKVEQWQLATKWQVVRQRQM